MSGPFGPERRYGNRMQYGLNDTQLTCALERGNFDIAEKIILENEDPGYLDEGAFDRIPLAIVLNPDPMYRLFPFNLHLAKLLVERGADPNLRIPMAQLQSSSASPMEYLVKYLEDAFDLWDAIESDEESVVISGKPENIQHVIGLHNEVNLTFAEVRVQLLELLDIFLAHGGDPNITTTSAHSTLFHTVLRNSEPSIDLILKLCEAGGDLNRPNAHRTTPLMDLVTFAEADTSLDILNSILEINPDISGLCQENCCYHTAVWRAMHSGSPQVTIELLKKGADPSTQALITPGSLYRSGKFVRSVPANLPYSISAIFAPLLGNSVPYLHLGFVTSSPREFMPEDEYEFNIDLFNKVMTYGICPVIDTNLEIFECAPELVEELTKLIEKMTNFKVNELESPVRKMEDIPVLLFGKLKAGLQQMCVHHILRCILNNSGTFLKLSQEVKSSVMDQDDQNASSINCIMQPNKKNSFDHWTLVQKLTPKLIDCLVTEHLGLPSALSSEFKIEASRLQLGACLFTMEIADCFQACDGDSDDGSFDTLFDSNINVTGDDDDERSSWLSESSQYEMDSVSFEGYISKVDTRVSSSSSASSSTSEGSTGSEECKDEDDSQNMEVDISTNWDTEVQLPQTGDSVCSIAESVASSENSKSSSGESIPHSICRDEYKQFNDDICNSDVSPSNITSMDDDDIHSE